MDLTLYEIEADLRALIDKREELEESTCFTPEEDRERLNQIADCDLAIHAWVEKSVRKVDGVRNWWKTCEQMAMVAAQESKAQAARAKQWDNRLSRIKAMCVSVMDSMGVKKLEGRTGTLSLRNNGGRQAVTVSDPALVPEEFQDITVTMPVRLWDRICADMAPAFRSDWRIGLRESMPVPRLEKIREALESRCSTCGGADTDCRNCGGSGYNGVPGCVLEPRGVHAECR